MDTTNYDAGFEAGMQQGQRDYGRGEYDPAQHRTSRRSDDYAHGFSAGYADAGES